MPKAKKREPDSSASLFDDAPEASPRPAIPPLPEVTPGQRRALDLSGNRVISASAGTGKTFTLTSLYVGLLSGRLVPGGTYLEHNEWLARANTGELPTLRPAQIVAVTFTEKAAGELRERIRKALEEILQTPALPPALLAHLRACAHELGAAPVTTIHAFCARLLRETGAEGPVPAAFNVIEGDAANELLRKAFSNAAAEMLDSGEHPFVEKLASTWGIFTPRSGLIETGERMLRQLRSRGLPPSALNATGAQRRLTLFEIARMLEEFYDVVATVKDKGNTKVKPETRAFCAQRIIPTTLEEARLLALELSPMLNYAWARNNNVSNPCPSIVHAANGPFVDAFTRYVELALEKYQALKHAENALDFDDLLLAARDLPPVVPGADPGIRFVLIDEFQDTNPLQKEILWRVAFGAQTPTPHARLCVVGDIKQSIYRFRGADVTLMQDAARTLGSTPLSINYRSRATVLEFINGFCATFWPPDFYSAEHRLQQMPVPERHAWKEPAGEVICWDDADLPSADEHRMQQAFALARRIRTLVAPAADSTLTRPVIFDRETNKSRSTVRFSDIAILANSLKHLRQPLQLALGQFNIPFQMLGGVSFYSRQEVIDVTNLWAAASNPHDAFAVAGLLRSPFVGLSDAGLWLLSDKCLAGPDGNSTSFEKLSLGSALLLTHFVDADWLKGFSENDVAALRRASAMLKKLCALSGRRTAVELLDWALKETGYLGILALQPRGEIAVAAVRKTIELARAFETQGNQHLSDFVRWLREQADAEWEEPGKKGGPDLGSELPPGEDAVSIGTVHSAKGLEFPIVILPELGGKGPNVTEAALYSETHGLGLKIADYFEGLESLGDSAHDANKEIEVRDCQAENLRKLYVAITRSRDYLIFLGQSKYSDTWRALLDSYWTANPSSLTRVKSDDVELKAATAGDAPGILEYANGAALVNRRVAAQIKGGSSELPPLRDVPQVLSETRVSVSRFAHWLWCPRQSAFEARERQFSSSRPTQSFSENETVAHGLHATSDADGRADELDLAPPGAAELGTAVHAALEIYFGAEDPNSSETKSLAAEAFARALSQAHDHPDVKAAHDCVLAFVRSDWGRRTLALPPAQRLVERPFRWPLDSGDRRVVLSGQMDALVNPESTSWQVVDFKFSSIKEGRDHAAAVARYAWQAGIYAQVAATILDIPDHKISAALAFLKDKRIEPRTVEDLGHARCGSASIEAAASQFGLTADALDPLALPAQRWLPGESGPHSRNRKLCAAERCPYVEQCFGRD